MSADVFVWWFIAPVAFLIGMLCGLAANLECIGRVARWRRAIELGEHDDVINAERESRI